jgi:hypothetical protein
LPAGVWYVDDGGALERVRSAYSAADRTVAFTPPHLSIYAVGYDGWPFEDVRIADWFYGDVDYVYQNGLMIGVSDTSFAPQSNLTRAMIVTILYRNAKEQWSVGSGKWSADGGTAFTDVSAGQWYTDAVSWASANGIVNGVGDNKFAPDDPVTREQFATVLFRFSQLSVGVDVHIDPPSRNSDLAAFTDAGDISDWARDAVAWAHYNGLVNGKPGNLLDPRGSATRAEAAALLRRYMEKAG